MRTLIRSTVFVLTLVGALGGLNAQEQQPRPAAATTVAVLPLAGKDDARGDVLAQAVSDLLQVSLARSTQLTVVEREDLNKAIKELKLATLQDEDARMKVGRFIGAKYLVTGTVLTKDGSQSTVNCQLIETESNRIAGPPERRYASPIWSRMSTPWPRRCLRANKVSRAYGRAD